MDTPVEPDWEFWEECIELLSLQEELHDDMLLELMSEPPGGHNHGRKRSAYGFVDLDSNVFRAIEGGLSLDEGDEQARKRAEKPKDTIRHGTLAAYTNDRCRCEKCRASMAEWKRRRRKDV